jgi:hypothetical protein
MCACGNIYMCTTHVIAEWMCDLTEDGSLNARAPPARAHRTRRGAPDRYRLTSNEAGSSRTQLTSLKSCRVLSLVTRWSGGRGGEPSPPRFPGLPYWYSQSRAMRFTTSQELTRGLKGQSGCCQRLKGHEEVVPRTRREALVTACTVAQVCTVASPWRRPGWTSRPPDAKSRRAPSKSWCHFEVLLVHGAVD